MGGETERMREKRGIEGEKREEEERKR